MRRGVRTPVQMFSSWRRSKASWEQLRGRRFRWPFPANPQSARGRRRGAGPGIGLDLPDRSTFPRSKTFKQASTSKLVGQFDAILQDVRRKTYDASIPNFGTILFSVRGGGRRLKGEAGIPLLSSSPEEKRVSSRSSESWTTSATRCLFGTLGGDGAAEVDPSNASVKLRPGYSPISGWGG
jgi:hypothetical protein